MKKDELPPGWAWSTLGQVATWGSGGTPKAKNPQFYGGDIPWAVIGDLTDGLVSTTKSTITREGLDNSSAKLVPEGAVLIAMYGSIGKLGIVSREMATNQAIAFAVPNPAVMRAKYLFWYLRSQRDDLIAAGKGGTQQNISQTVLKSWRIAIPPVAEQERIVDVLEDHLSRLDAAAAYIDSAVERSIRVIERVTDYSHACTASRSSGYASPPSSVGVNDGELPRIPADWEWCRLGEIAEVVGGVTKDRKKQSDPEYVEVPYLRVANVQRGRLDLDDIAMIRVAPKKAQQLEIKPGDVLLNEGGDRNKLGRGWIWCGEIPRMIHQNHVFRARVRDSRIHPKLLSWHANSSARWFEENGKQSVNLASISLSKIKLLPVPVPPPELQDGMVSEIEDRLSMVEKSLEESKKALVRAQRLRRALLASAFAGKLVPQDPSEQPASYLVERIRTERSAQPKPKRRRAVRAAATSARPAPPVSFDPAGTFVQEELGL